MVKVIAYPVMVLSAVGVLLCFSFYFLGLAGVYPFPAKGTFVFGAGVVLVWFPAVMLMSRLTQDFKQKDMWKAALRGCPGWMRTGLWVVIGCAVAFSFLPSLFMRSSGNSSQTPPLFPVLFYAVSFCVMYSLINVQKQDPSRRCLNGHPISPSAKFCEECGSQAAAENRAV